LEDEPDERNWSCHVRSRMPAWRRARRPRAGGPPDRCSSRWSLRGGNEGAARLVALSDCCEPRPRVPRAVPGRMPMSGEATTSAEATTRQRRGISIFRAEEAAPLLETDFMAMPEMNDEQVAAGAPQIYMDSAPGTDVRV